jgi:hypothetical protein
MNIVDSIRAYQNRASVYVQYAAAIFLWFGMLVALCCAMFYSTR